MTSAFVIPYDHQATGEVAPGVNPSQLWAQTPASDKIPKAGTTRIFYNTPAGKVTVVSSLGPGFPATKGDARREAVRKAVGSAVKDLKALDGITEILVDSSVDPHAAAVAAYLSLYKFSLKTSPPSRFNPSSKELIPPEIVLKPIKDSKEWDQGVIYAQAQNLVRTLMELPANILTPTTFCERVKKEFAGLRNVEVIVHDTAWAAEKKMNTFLSVTHGTSEPAKVLEVHYKGAASKDERPLALVGKGITFDSGGISLKPADGMKRMRGDMGGAAVVVGTALAVAQLQLPVNLVVVTPLTENLPGPSATKPGDIIYAMNGKSVEVDNTDAEGRLVLSDAIYYASTEFKPHTLIDVATLTGAIRISVGELYSGVYPSSDNLWKQLHAAGEAEFDRFWRMPLDDDYGFQIHGSNADLQNIGGAPAGSCTAALFLKAFAEGIDSVDGKEPIMQWAHMDISGAKESEREIPYYEKGFNGRPARALIEYVRRLSKA